MRLERKSASHCVAALLLALTSVFTSPASAQHATAFDIENGARAYQTSCAACHGPDGNLILGIDFGRGVFRRALTDEEITGIILTGIPNTPMPPMAGMAEEQAVQIVAYLRSLPETAPDTDAVGDAARGREIVTRSGDCLECHRVGTAGSRLGPDLSRIGLDRRAAELMGSLVEPNAEVQPAQRFYQVTPKRGEPVTGRLLNHDTYTVQLLDAEGELRSFIKANLSDFGFVESPMPSYRDTLDEQALADVVSYLVSLRGGSTP